MANSPFLTTVARPRDPSLLWPIAAIASLLAHVIGLGLVRTLAIQTPVLPEGEMAPLPVQLISLPADLPNSGTATDVAAPSDADAPAPAEPTVADAPSPMVAQTAPAVQPPPAEVPTPLQPTAPPIEPQPQPQPAPPSVDRPPPRPAPPVAPAPVAPAPIAPVAPAPPRPTPPDAAASGVDTPPVGSSGVGSSGEGMPASEGGTATAGGQVVPVGIRLNPNGRDIPETAPQLLSTTAIEVRPLASGCGFANLDALLAGITAASVQMQIRVEPSGDISDVRLLQSTGSGAVDDLVGCVIRQRLKLQPATSAGVPQLTDAFILDARLQF